MLLPNLCYLKWLWATPPPQIFWWILLLNAIALQLIALYRGLASMPYLMRLYPQSRFGQFCSAGSTLRSVIVLFFGYAIGIFIDLLKINCGMGERAFRYIYVWQLFWLVLATVFILKTYRWWLRMGGEKAYRAPAPWSAEKFEPMPVTAIQESSPLYSRILLVCLSAFYGAMLLGAAGLYAAAARMALETEAHGMLCHAFPAASAAAIAWMVVLFDIRRKNRSGKNFSIHHGVLLILAVRQCATLGINFYQSVSTLRLNTGIAATLWMQESIIAIAVACIVWLLAAMEQKTFAKKSPLHHEL